MEPINTNNYESAFLAYHEGTLSPEQIRELMAFIEKHPELKEELESFEDITLPKETEPASFKNKDSLKKMLITEANREEYFVASAEGILSATEAEALNIFLLSHPELAAEYALFQKTILVPETNIVYPDKDSLRKETTVNPVVSEEEMTEALEGLLSVDRKATFETALLADAGLQKEYSLFQKTILVADMAIVYPNKEKLKRRKSRIIWLPAYTYLAAAASIAILFMIWFFAHQPSEEKIVPGLAHADPAKEMKLLKPETEKAASNLALSNATEVSKTDGANRQRTSSKNGFGHKKEHSVSVPVIQAGNEELALVLHIFPALQANLNQEIKETPFRVLKAVAASSPVSDRKQGQEKQDEFMNIRQFAASKFQEQVTDALIGEKGKRHIGWSLAKTAARTFNRISARKIKINENFDDHGELVSYALNGGGLEYARAFKK
jgi:anti-sigma factor RsiW